MRTADVKTINPILDSEAEEARAFYDGTDEQPPTYDEGVPVYAQFIANVVATTQSQRVLEFGCNAGRNLDLIRRLLPHAELVGMDLNRKMIELGAKRYGLDLRVCDDLGLTALPSQAFDTSFTVSVVDHIPFPESTLRHLLRITKNYLILFEICGNRLGKADTIVMEEGGQARDVKSYPFSYLHDYRAECERKFGALCVAELQFPISTGNLLDLYRMFVFTPRRELYDKQLVTEFALKPLAD